MILETSIGAKGPGALPLAFRYLSGTIFTPETYRRLTGRVPQHFISYRKIFIGPVRFFFVRYEFLPERYRRLTVKNINPTGTLSAKKKSYRTSPVQIYIRPGVYFRLFMNKFQVLFFKSKNLRELRPILFIYLRK